MTSSDVLRTLLLLLTLGDADLEQVYQLRWLPLILMAAYAIAQVAGLVRVVPQLAARVIEPELMVCPVCHGTGRNPEAPRAIADDDGTCPRCCDPRHPLYAAHHGHVLQDARSRGR